MSTAPNAIYRTVIDDIGRLAWDRLSEDECIDTVWAYYFFSIQFRENLFAARELHPTDEKLIDLQHGECHTDNLSPWPGVAEPGERMHHDEFMRRTLSLAPISGVKRQTFQATGENYLNWVRSLDKTTRAMSIASYEDGGLEAVFTAMLTMPDWPSPALKAFRHFLSEHIRFDSDADAGHGALARHLQPDDRIEGLWVKFRDLLVAFAPGLAQPGVMQAAE